MSGLIRQNAYNNVTRNNYPKNSKIYLYSALARIYKYAICIVLIMKSFHLN